MRAVAILCGLALLLTAPAARATAIFMGLGTLPGKTDSGAWAVSADGSTVVGDSGADGFRWTQATGMVSLGGGNRTAAAVSADGSVVVGTQSGPEPYRWTASVGSVGLGFGGSARGVSADGSVVVGDLTDFEAFRWTSDTGAVGLGTLPGMSYSQALGVSADGSIVVGESSGPGGEAFLWTFDAGMLGLGTLPGASTSAALAVSADGFVVVGGASSDTGEVQAFRWTSSGGMVGLGTLPGAPVVVSQAYAVSADGSVVVGAALGSDEVTEEAFIWDAAHGMRSLKDALTGDYGLDLTGWTLDAAYGVSADGRTIVGFGSNPDGPEAWIAVIPEPSTGLLLPLGLVCLAARRRARG